MKNHGHHIMPIIALLILTMIGCDDNENARLARMAEENLQRQAEQNRQMAEMHGEIAKGARNLVQADAEARQEILAAQQQLQSEQAQVGHQRDELERERRDIAQQRHRDPLIAAAITGSGLILACLLPLVLCWFLLRQPAQAAEDPLVLEVLLTDLVAEEPLLLVPRELTKQIRETRTPSPSSTYEDWPSEH